MPKKKDNYLPKSTQAATRSRRHSHTDDTIEEIQCQISIFSKGKREIASKETTTKL